MKIDSLRKIVFIALILGLFLNGCGSSTPASKKHKDGTPVSHQATFIESSGSSLTMVRATGDGATLQEAKDDSARAAIWFVLRSGNNKLLQTPAERKKFHVVAKEFYDNAKKYFGKISDIKSKKKDADGYVIDIVYTINVELLKEDLIANNVLKDVEDLTDSIGTPSIAVVVSDTTTRDSKAQMALDAVSEYLQDRDFEVTVLNENSKANSMVSKILKLQGAVDPIYTQALSVGSDIYISINISFENSVVAGKDVSKAAVSMKAFWTATGKQIGAATGYSPARVNTSVSALAVEASNDASDKILGQIQKSWKKSLKRGKTFKLIAISSESLAKKIDMPFYRALKRTCKVKRNYAGSTVYDYNLTCKNVSDVMELLDKIQNSYSGEGKIFRISDMGMFLTIKIANSEDEEVDFE